MATLNPLRFEAPPVNPSPQGLLAATVWPGEIEGSAPADARHLVGVEVRGPNFGVEDAAGVWETNWCGAPPLDNTERKEGERPDILDSFEAFTVWGYDECDLTPASRAEVPRRALQILRLTEQASIEREFADRLIVDATALPGAIQTATGMAAAIGYLEAQLALVGVLGFIHVGAQWAAVGASEQVIRYSGTKITTPLGHTLIFGGGYVDGLDDTLVATSQPYGWRNEPTVRNAMSDTHPNLFAAVAERTVTIGYEAVITAVTIT